MHFTIPTFALLALTTGAIAGSGGSHPQYSNHLSPSHSSYAAVTTPIPTNSHSSSKAVRPSRTSAVPSKSSSAVKPSKTAGGGGHGGSGSGSGSGSGGEGGEGGEGSVPTYVPGNPAARIDAQEATFLGAALGALGAFAALV